MSFELDDHFKALCRLLETQARLNCYPACEVSINGYTFRLNNKVEPEGWLKCELDPALLARILRREEHWNNAELGCHIMFERKGPYMPDVHTLMCFFHA